MLKGNYQRMIATWILVSCLVLAVPQVADARPFEPSFHDQTEIVEPTSELTLWERLWQRLSSWFDTSSVLIIPD